MKLTDEEKIEIIEKYKNPKTTLNSLAKEYGVLATTIASLLKRRGVKIRSSKEMQYRKYTLNENYFDIIDTEGKAYFLGLLYADGCNHRDKKRKGFSIGLTEEDRAILEKFQEELNSDRPLTYYHKLSGRPQWTLSIDSPKISESLLKLGCVPRKSLVLEFPTSDQVPEHLISHFIRGYFDGDGCISHYLRHGPIKMVFTASFSITGTLSFCKMLSKIILKELDIIVCLTNNGERQFCITTEGRHKVIKILNWIYKESHIYLNRKHSKFLFIKEEFSRLGVL